MTKENIIIYIIIGMLVLLNIFSLYYDFNIIEKSDDKFICNPYYFGKMYPEVCEHPFINATGNYCNGELVCKNRLR